MAPTLPPVNVAGYAGAYLSAVLSLLSDIVGS